MNKRLIFFFILVFPLIVTHQLCAQPAYNYVRSYEVKTGLVEYHNWWTGEAGSIIKFWWDDYGQKYREEFITKEEIKSINLANGSYFYTLNMQTLKGSKVEADVAAQIQEYYASQHSTYERGRETILGFECQATETADIITLSYKGVTLRESDASFGGDWLEAYFFDANAIIERADSDENELTAEEKEYFSAEAKFFRGYMYKMLANLYGNVPVVLEETKSPKRDYENSERQAVYQQAASDLADAANVLGDISEVPDHKIQHNQKGQRDNYKYADYKSGYRDFNILRRFFSLLPRHKGQGNNNFTDYLL